MERDYSLTSLPHGLPKYGRTVLRCRLRTEPLMCHEVQCFAFVSCNSGQFASTHHF